jgi:LuxR family maltose regulon positive regulatory protein
MKRIENQVGESALAMLRSPQPPPGEAVLTSLINEIANFQCKIVLVLDDYHLIEAQEVHDALSFLLENLPPQLHLVIATREDPLLPLSRLRARNQITELRATNLRFSPAEVADFLNQVMCLGLSSEEISALETRTEGWIAGLQLAAISLQGQADTSRFIQTFTGSNRLVLDYLIEEVLNQQSRAIQTFLLQTSILNRLTGSLCDSLTGQEDGRQILEMLERANLFIIPLDAERRWYRYHHLFTDLLRQRLKNIHPELVTDFHAKAAEWYEKDGNLSEAIYHAFAANDTITAIRLIEKGSLAALEQSEFGFILNTVDQLPKSALKNAPWLFVYHAWALILMGYIDRVAPRLKDTDWLLDAISEDEKQKMRGYIAGLKQHLAGWRRDYTNIIELTNQAKENLPENHWIRGYCAMALGTVFWGNGNLKAARETFTEAASVGKSSGNRRVAVASDIYLGHSLELEGKLQKSAEYFRDSLQLTKQDGKELPLSAYLHVDFARVLYEMNELESAVHHLQEGIKRCQWLSENRVEKIGHRILSRVYLAHGDLSNAHNSIQIGEQTHPSAEPKVDMRGTEYIHIWLFLKQNKIKKMIAWLEESDLNLNNVSHFKTKMTYTMHARILIAVAREYPGEKYLDDALALLAQLLDLSDRNGWGKKLIEILVLRALAFDLCGNTGQAMRSLDRALQLAEPEGFVRTFVDEGPPLARLLYEALPQGISPDYIQRLLAAFPEIELEQTTPSKQSSDDEWIEPLTERELEVLQLIADGLTNQEIASKLYLSLNTVKAHTRSIYGKLDVKSRAQAAARARALGLINID